METSSRKAELNFQKKFSNHYPLRGWKLPAHLTNSVAGLDVLFSNHYPSRGWKYIRDLVKVGVDCAIAFS